MGDMELQQVATAKNLTSLKLSQMKWVTPMGLLMLFQRMPALTTVSVLHCSMKQAHLDQCAEMLGTQVSFLEGFDQ